MDKLFNIQVNAKSALPVYEQVKQIIKFAILSGKLKEGDRLFSLRELAVKLQINPNTIIKVYTQLENEGFIFSRPGAGYYVKIEHKQIKKAKEELFEKISDDYASRALELGYSPEEILEQISKKTNKK